MKVATIKTISGESIIKMTTNHIFNGHCLVKEGDKLQLDPYCEGCKEIHKYTGWPFVEYDKEEQPLK